MREIDARLSSCPGPLFEAIRGIRESSIGETFSLLATDQRAEVDIPLWLASAGQTLLAKERADGTTRYVIRRDR